MSRPRKPFGASHPGRLPSTMIKVLAAEMADPERLRRGKRYAKDGSVLDIAIEPGTVVCEVQGSRPTPYVATIEVTPGDGMPLRRDIEAYCSCPDFDVPWGAGAAGSQICKHVVAAMFVFADELLLEPELLDVWRDRDSVAGTRDDPASGPAAAPTRAPADDGDETSRAGRRRGHLRLVGGAGADETAVDRHPQVPPPDPLADLLVTPAGSTLPEIGDIERLEPTLPARRELADAIRSAHAHLHIEWE